MFFDPSSGVGGVVAAEHELDRVLEALAVAGPGAWEGPAARAYGTARDGAAVSVHAADARLRWARECVRAFEQERATWGGLPRGWW
ncbi:MAG: hypothetical protein EOL91_07595 [Actinobacteria bacterium]|nr:hypothetical protein [Actinomycetota bacterium]